MADRTNHYEAAFEEFLRARRIPYVAVDEARRSTSRAESLKSLDFIITPGSSSGWLVDVKGRQFPAGRRRQYWKNWSTWDDLRSLARWEEALGGRFRALFVFAYNVVADRSPLPADELFQFRGRWYGFVAIPLAHYVSFARPISSRWQTLAMPTRRFRQLAAPLTTFLS